MIRHWSRKRSRPSWNFDRPFKIAYYGAESIPWTESSGTCVFRLWERDWRQGWPGKKGRLAKRWTKCTSPPSMRRIRTSKFIAWRKRCSQNLQLFSPFFLFHLLLSSFPFFSPNSCTINLPAGQWERILFVSGHKRLIIEAKFPQITMKHGVINVRCVRGNRVHTCRAHLATDWPRRVVRLRTLPLVRDRILNFTRFVSRLGLAAAFKFE